MFIFDWIFDGVNFLINLKLGWFIRWEYTAMFFFMAGSLAGQYGKNIKVRAANWFTISIISFIFFFYLIVISSARGNGKSGQDLYNIMSNEFLISIINLVLIWLLLNRMIKTCRAERVRKFKLFNRQAQRKLRNV